MWIISSVGSLGVLFATISGLKSRPTGIVAHKIKSEDEELQIGLDNCQCDYVLGKFTACASPPLNRLFVRTWSCVAGFLFQYDSYTLPVGREPSACASWFKLKKVESWTALDFLNMGTISGTVSLYFTYYSCFMLFCHILALETTVQHTLHLKTDVADTRQSEMNLPPVKIYALRSDWINHTGVEKQILRSYTQDSCFAFGGSAPT